MTHNQHYKFYVASCEPDGGIFYCEIKDNKAQIIEKTPMDRPMYMISDGEKMNVVLREPFADNPFSGVATYIIKEGRISECTGITSTKGEVACHICSLDNALYCVNYISGSVIKLPEKLVTHSGKGINPKRQEKAHTHYINSFDGKYLLCTDLGTDEIYTYDKDLNEVSRAKVPEGHGARHLINKGNRIFCVNELGSTVSEFEYDEGVLKYIRTERTLEENKTGENNTTAAIRIKDDFLYISNRGDDSIAVFDISDNGLKFIKTVPCGGEGPRDFNIFGDLIVCTNQFGNNVTFFEIQNGIPMKLDTELKIKTPLCVI